MNTTDRDIEMVNKEMTLHQIYYNKSGINNKYVLIINGLLRFNIQNISKFMKNIKLKMKNTYMKVLFTFILSLSLGSLFAQTQVTPEPGFDLAFRYANPGVYFITVPANVSVLRVKLWGGGGGGGTFPLQLENTGGAAGYTRVDIPVIPGHVYALVVGTRGVCDDSAQFYPVYGFGGEKNDFCKGGTGGGLTGIFDGNIAPTEYFAGAAIAIAGGGGGASGFDPPYCWARGGNGNMPTPLSGGMGSMRGQDNGTECTVGEQSGGGGGYEGGEIHYNRTGGGNTCYLSGDIFASKGGSGFILPLATYTNKIIAYTPDWGRFPPNMTDMHYISGRGVGGLGHGTSGDGLAIIEYTCLDNAGPDQSVACYQTGTATMAATGTGTWSLVAGSAGTATITTPTSPTTTVTNFSAAGTYYMVWSNGSCTDTALITVGSNCGATGCTTPSCSATGPSSGITGTSYTFTVSSITPSCASVTWTAPGATPSSGSGTTAVVSWSGVGAYAVTFTATNDCSPSGCSPSATSTCAVNINISSGGTSCPSIQNVCNPPASASPASTCTTFNGCINIDYGTSSCAVAVGTVATLCVDSCGVTITRTTTVGTGGIGVAAFCSFVPGTYSNGIVSYTDQANVTHTDNVATQIVGVTSGSCPTCGSPVVSCPTPDNNCVPAMSTSAASTCTTANGCIIVDYSTTPCRSPRISVGDTATLCIDSCSVTITRRTIITAGPVATFCGFTPGTYTNGIVKVSTTLSSVYTDAIPTATIGVLTGGPCITCVANCTANAGADQTVACYLTGTATMAATGTGTWSLGAGSAGTATITNSTSPTTTVTNFSTAGTYYMIWNDGTCKDTALIIANNNCTGNPVSCVSGTKYQVQPNLYVISGASPLDRTNPNNLVSNGDFEVLGTTPLPYYICPASASTPNVAVPSWSCMGGGPVLMQSTLQLPRLDFIKQTMVQTHLLFISVIAMQL